MKPNPAHYKPYFETYIKLVNSDNLVQELIQNEEKVTQLITSIPPEKENYRYAQDKWSIKELFQHLIDAERIFQYRALAISRNDRTELPGYDEDEYVINAPIHHLSLTQMLDDFYNVRKSTISLFSNFEENTLNNVGIADGNPLSVNACGFIICGHTIHHTNILKERYL